MSAQCMLDADISVKVSQRPRIALMGEFSAGKSTLANLLLGQDMSPVKVTATQLPPIWYRHGNPSVLRIDNAGYETSIDPNSLETISHKDTQAVRILMKSEVLKFCDLIDMPGTSDPNMPSEMWERMLSRCDAVVWCTPSTQAWRQSEAAVWENLPEALRTRSLLLITRMDKMLTQSDRDRVVARVRRETEDLFSQVLPISLTEAIAADDNAEVLQRCGAERFVDCLIEMVESFGTLPADPKIVPSEGFDAVVELVAEQMPVPAAATPMTQVTVIPRRVVPKGRRRTQARS